MANDKNRRRKKELDSPQTFEANNKYIAFITVQNMTKNQETENC